MSTLILPRHSIKKKAVTNNNNLNRYIVTPSSCVIQDEKEFFEVKNYIDRSLWCGNRVKMWETVVIKE